MKKNKLIIIVISAISVLIISILGYNLYKNYRIKNATKIVKLKSNEIEVYEELNLKDIIESINGKLLSNPKINTKKLGKKKIKFDYINDENIKIPYEIEVSIVDKTPPIIGMQNTLTKTVGSTDDISKDFFCGDNFDDNPNCFIEGDYSLNEVGNYPLTFIGIDSSNNKSSHDFTLIVKEKSKTQNNNTTSKRETTDFKQIIKKYKSKDTKIGIDVSHWQGDIDFEKVKSANVEFVYIRVGRGDGIGKDYVLDKKFIKNIEGFNKVNIPVGVYFYSSANSKNDAIKEAKWVIKQIKKYNVELEIVFDWENWDSFQDYDLSFYKLTELSKAFNDTVVKEGYKGMLYSSKNYLENIWYPVTYPVWLAHYTDKTDYSGKYKVWQLCSNGKVEGIDDNLVDINVMYS